MYNAANNASSQLAQAIGAEDTSLTVLDGSDFPDAPFVVSIEDEIIEVGAKDGNTFLALVRGTEGTTPASHASGSRVENRFTAGTYQKVVDDIISHSSNQNNPHGVTAAQVNLSPGVISAYGGNAAPGGWLECNGQAVSRTTYSALFSAIGTIWGAGNGSSTFNVPDLRGEFIRGWDNGRGVDSGRALGSYQSDTLQNITGTAYAVGNKRGMQIPNASGAFAALEKGTGHDASIKEGTSVEWSFDASRVARTANETRPRNKAVMYIIKY